MKKLFKIQICMQACIAVILIVLCVLLGSLVSVLHKMTESAERISTQTKETVNGFRDTVQTEAREIKDELSQANNLARAVLRDPRASALLSYETRRQINGMAP